MPRPFPLTFEECRAHFDMPVADAQICLRVSRPTISKVLRAHGIKRWPYRKLRAKGQLDYYRRLREQSSFPHLHDTSNNHNQTQNLTNLNQNTTTTTRNTIDLILNSDNISNPNITSTSHSYRRIGRVPIRRQSVTVQTIPPTFTIPSINNTNIINQQSIQQQPDLNVTTTTTTAAFQSGMVESDQFLQKLLDEATPEDNFQHVDYSPTFQHELTNPIPTEQIQNDLFFPIQSEREDNYLSLQNSENNLKVDMDIDRNDLNFLCDMQNIESNNAAHTSMPVCDSSALNINDYDINKTNKKRRPLVAFSNSDENEQDLENVIKGTDNDSSISTCERGSRSTKTTVGDDNWCKGEFAVDGSGSVAFRFYKNDNNDEFCSQKHE